ncbi:MAG: Unknown protein [uncultured Sulfurovum sp.]|uniref:Uncharacterized protein n=1 Tax=uncultured Sulfurovum sp. TaxID=269237 RepID=A0A6S6SWT6_9BACT|nr:MAG: Unknown protein [uncultured Sulfurovum sp.]
MSKDLDERADFYEYDRLESKLNLEEISYKEILFISISFIKKIALAELNKNEIGLSHKYINIVLDAIDIVTNLENKSEEFKIYEFERVKIWKYHHEIQDKMSLDKLFLRVSVCCFFDESFAIKDSIHYNVEDVLDNLYTLLYELEPKLCKQFTDHVLSSICPLQTDSLNKK